MMNSYKDLFEKNMYVYLPGFLDADTVDTISRYFEYSINSRNHGWVKDSKDVNNDIISKFSKYGDPLIEVVLRNSTKEIESVTGKELLPTYSYSRIYRSGDELKKHTDRVSCEYSVTINIASRGFSVWPVYMKAPGCEVSRYTLEPGDAIIYKGCEVEHWREKMSDSDINVQIMLHYVDKYGLYANNKWDGRPSLGLPAETSYLRR